MQVLTRTRGAPTARQHSPPMGSSRWSAMQWANLRAHGDTPHHAFEALCSVLFERWCRDSYAGRLSSFHVTGAGGDGGVESLARLDDATAIGLQCKWFRDPMGASQFAQI